MYMYEIDNAILKYQMDTLLKSDTAISAETMNTFIAAGLIDNAEVLSKSVANMVGLVAKQVQVTRNGKTFTQTFYVRSGADAPAATGSKTQPAPKAGKSIKESFESIERTQGRDAAMKHLKDNGVTWKENDHAGINWMRAKMAASKATGTIIQTPTTDTKPKNPVATAIAQNVKPDKTLVAGNKTIEADTIVRERLSKMGISGEQLQAEALLTLNEGVPKSKRISEENIKSIGIVKIGSATDDVTAYVTLNLEYTNPRGATENDDIVVELPIIKPTDGRKAGGNTGGGKSKTKQKT